MDWLNGLNGAVQTHPKEGKMDRNVLNASFGPGHKLIKLVMTMTNTLAADTMARQRRRSGLAVLGTNPWVMWGLLLVLVFDPS